MAGYGLKTAAVDGPEYFRIAKAVRLAKRGRDIVPVKDGRDRLAVLADGRRLRSQDRGRT